MFYGEEWMKRDEHFLSPAETWRLGIQTAEQNG